MFSLDETLLEDMLENILKIMKLVVLELEFNQLSCNWLVDTGSLVVGEPEFCSSHDGGSLNDMKGLVREEEECRNEVCWFCQLTRCGVLNTFAIVLVSGAQMRFNSCRYDM